MGQALFLKTIMMRDSDLTSFLETKSWNDRKQKDAKVESKKRDNLFCYPLHNMIISLY